MLPILIFTICLLLAVAAQIFQQLDGIANDPGLGWHLKTGEYIWTHGQLPLTDPFLAYPNKLPYIFDQWASDLILYLVFHVGGWPLLYALTLITYLAVYFLVLIGPNIRNARSVVIGSLATLCVFKLGLIHFIVRPVIFGFLCFAILYAILLSARERISKNATSEEQLASIRQLFIFLPLLMVVWTNLHPSFVLGLFLIGLFLAALTVERFAKKASFSPRITNAFVAILVLCLFATFINPAGLGLWDQVLALGQSKFFMNLNEEWKGLELGSAHGGLLLGLIFIVFTTALIAPDRIRSLGVFPLISAGIFVYLSGTAVRFLPFAAIALGPVLAGSLSGLWSYLRKFKSKSSVDDYCEGRTKLIGANRAIFVLFAIGILTATLIADGVPLYSGEYGPSAKLYPYNLLREIVATAPVDKQLKLYTTPNWGGFITLYGEQKAVALLDDRNSLLGEQPYKDFLATQKIEVGWRAKIKETGADLLLVPRDSTLFNYLSENKKPTLSDDVGAAFLVVEL